MTWQRADDERSLVQSLNGFLETTQSLTEFQAHFHDQVVVLSLKNTVFLLIQHNDYVSRFQSRFLVTFSMERDLLAISHA